MMADEPASTEEAASGSDDGTGGKKDGLGKKNIKNEHVLIAIGIITLILTYFFLRKQSTSATTANANTTSASPYGTTSYPTGDDGYDASGTDSDDSYDDSVLASDIQQLQSEITGLTPPTSVPGTTALQTAPAPTTPAATTPASYVGLTNAQGAQDLLAQGQSLYYAIPGAPAGTYGQVADPEGPQGQWLAGNGGAPLPTGTGLYIQEPGTSQPAAA
jgi:hypothetical protein